MTIKTSATLIPSPKNPGSGGYHGYVVKVNGIFAGHVLRLGCKTVWGIVIGDPVDTVYCFQSRKAAIVSLLESFED